MSSTSERTSKRTKVVQRGGALMSVAECAALLAISSWSCYELARQGAIPHRRFGRRVVFSRPEIERWLAGTAPIAQSAEA
jgi:excisionase family DNA binding protein